MGAGKPLAVLAGILVLASTYFLALFHISPDQYGSGLNLIMNVMDIFTNPTNYAGGTAQAWLVYLLAGVFIVFLLAGVFLLIGVKNRGFEIAGALLALGVSLYVILTGYAFAGGSYLDMMAGSHLVADIIPYHLGLGGSPITMEVSLGTWTLFGGGILGVVSAMLGRD